MLLKENVKLRAIVELFFSTYCGMYKVRGGTLQHFIHKVAPREFERSLHKIYNDDKRACLRLNDDAAEQAFEKMWEEIREELKEEI